LAAPREVQVGHSETVFPPECGAVLEEVSRMLGILCPWRFPRPSYTKPWLPSSAVCSSSTSRRRLGWAPPEVFSTHFDDPVILSLQSTGQTLAVPTSHRSPTVTTETEQTPQTWPLQALHLLHHGSIQRSGSD